MDEQFQRILRVQRQVLDDLETGSKQLVEEKDKYLLKKEEAYKTYETVYQDAKTQLVNDHDASMKRLNDQKDAVLETAKDELKKRFDAVIKDHNNLLQQVVNQDGS